MSRFETVIFDDFSDGEQCDIFPPTEKSFKNSNDVIIQNNKITLGKKVQGGALDDLDFKITGIDKVAFLKAGYLYVIGVHSVSDKCVIKRINVSSGAVSVEHTFSGGGDEAWQFIKFKETAIVSIKDGTYKIQYNDDGGLVNWTNCGTIGAGIYIMDHEIVNDRLFVLCSDQKIYYSDDGISFTLLITLDSYYNHNSFFYIDGYFFIQNWRASGSNSGLCRVSLDGQKQDEIVSIGYAQYFQASVFNGKIYALVNKRFLYRVDGHSLTPIFVFKNDCVFIPSTGFVTSLFFFDDTDDDIIVMDIFEKFSRPYNIVSNIDYTLSIHRYSDNYVLALHSLSSVLKVSLYENKYVSPGNIKTYEFRTKGLLTPIQANILHQPLTANAWIKVYVKKDGASSWGSAVIDSNTTNAIAKAYNFPEGDELRFIEFKIELGTNDDSETPEDPKLEFIYLPMGLANSQ